MLIFRSQFKLTERERQALRRICLFTVTLYARAWFSAPNSCDAPYNDLCLHQALESYRTVDNQVAEIALRKLRGHLWYLSEDLVGLTFFSNSVDDYEKQAMADALKKPKTKSDLRRVDPKAVVTFLSITLSHFVTERTMNLFDALTIKSEFLSTQAALWSENPAYLEGKRKVAGLWVINDCAERAVKLATDFNSTLTKDDDQRQLIYQVVEYHRQLITVPRMKDFVQHLQD